MLDNLELILLTIDEAVSGRALPALNCTGLSARVVCSVPVPRSVVSVDSPVIDPISSY